MVDPTKLIKWYVLWSANFISADFPSSVKKKKRKNLVKIPILWVSFSVQVLLLSPGRHKKAGWLLWESVEHPFAGQNRQQTCFTILFILLWEDSQIIIHINITFLLHYLGLFYFPMGKSSLWVLTISLPLACLTMLTGFLVWNAISVREKLSKTVLDHTLKQ